MLYSQVKCAKNHLFSVRSFIQLSSAYLNSLDEKGSALYAEDNFRVVMIVKLHFTSVLTLLIAKAVLVNTERILVQVTDVF